MKQLTVIGGGEHARVVIETARSQPAAWHVDGFVDPSPSEETQRRLGAPRLETDEEALARPGEHHYVLGVGATAVDSRRRAIVARYAGVRFAALVHVSASVSSTAIIEEGAVILAGAIVQSGARIGAHVIVGSGAIVEHDVQIGAFALLGPGAVIGGGAAIGEDAFVGLGARIRDHVSIGARATVAMGAVVIGDVPDHQMVLGVPARPRVGP